jgi:prolipoprotein diacylglyceryltransferase
MNSEILGVPTDVPWAVVFSRVDPLPRHPAQLYEALAYFATFALLFSLYRKKGADVPRGLLTGAFFTCVFGARFLIEFVKERHTPLTEGLPLSMGQILSIPLVALGIAAMWWAWTARRPA